MPVPHRGQNETPGPTLAPQREQAELSGAVIDTPRL